MVQSCQLTATPTTTLPHAHTFQLLLFHLDMPYALLMQLLVSTLQLLPFLAYMHQLILMDSELVPENYLVGFYNSIQLFHCFFYPFFMWTLNALPQFLLQSTL